MVDKYLGSFYPSLSFFGSHVWHKVQKTASAYPCYAPQLCWGDSNEALGSINLQCCCFLYHRMRTVCRLLPAQLCETHHQLYFDQTELYCPSKVRSSIVRTAHLSALSGREFSSHIFITRVSIVRTDGNYISTIAVIFLLTSVLQGKATPVIHTLCIQKCPGPKAPCCFRWGSRRKEKRGESAANEPRQRNTTHTTVCDCIDIKPAVSIDCSGK